jgi:hypothetical protein
MGRTLETAAVETKSSLPLLTTYRPLRFTWPTSFVLVIGHNPVFEFCKGMVQPDRCMWLAEVERNRTGWPHVQPLLSKCYQ